MRPCTYRPGIAADGWDPDGYGDIAGSGYVFFEFPDRSIGRRFPDGHEQRVFIRDCPTGISGPQWVDVGITIDDVVDDATDRARRQIPLPVLDMNPSPAVGGIVNLGVWLALQAPPPVTVRAEAGPLWAEATASLTSTRWDMGDGTVVECAGAGTPIVDVETVEQGPCGHTYRRSTPDATPHRVTITARWAITYRSTAGAGTAPGIERTLTVDYDIDEIQTIGVSN